MSAEVIGRAIRREVRRRAAQQDAHIYASTTDPDLEDDSYLAWAKRTSSEAWSYLD